MPKPSEETIIHYLQGTCSEEEIVQMSEWIALSDDNAREIFNMQQLYEELQARSMSADEVEQALQESLRRNQPRRQMPRWLSYAATLLVGLVLGAAVLFMEQQRSDSLKTIFADGNINKELVLPDGTHIWLNKGSRLWYPAEFDGDLREVRMEGEGFFEVAKDKEHPFVINNKLMTIRVLGTKFNYKVEKEHGEVTLLEGSVGVTTPQNQEMQLLQPGQRVDVDGRSGKLMISQADMNTAAIWHTRLITFKNANISSIAQTLEKLYGVTVYIDRGIDTKRTYSGAIEYKENLDSVLMLLQNTLPVKYSRNGNSITLRQQ